MKIFPTLRLRSFLSVLPMLLCAWCGLAQAQVFDRLYRDSVAPVLAQPLQWVAVDRDSIASPDELELGKPLDFQDYTDHTVLPTSATREVWARFALPPTTSLQSWFMRLPGQAVYRLSLYSRNPQGGWQMQAAGQAIAPAQWALRTRVPSFELQTRGDTPQVYYFRIEHHRAVTERPMLLSPVEYVDGASRVGVVIGLMWGTVALLTLLCLGAFALARNTVFLWFGALVVTLMAAQLVLIGYGSWRMWPNSAHLNQAMGWASSFLAMAASAWFCTQASYTRSAHPRIHRLLAFIASVSLLLAGLTAVLPIETISRDLRSLWMAFATLGVMGSLAWMSFRGQAWNLLLLLGTAPIGLATLNRLAYNAGWVLNVEEAQAAGVMSAMLGLLWGFAALAWRSRAALFSNQRGAALATYDAASGLMLPRVLDTRLAPMLLRARRQKSECGVLMLDWLDQSPSHDAAGDEKRGAALSRIGEILRGAARDVDTVARLDEHRFAMLVEGPISRNALSDVSTKILADCIRASEKLDDPGAFKLRIAIWHGTPGQQTGEAVMNELRARLQHMATGDQRPVQFVDALSAPHVSADPAEQDASRREDLLAKINEIEISHPPFADAGPTQAPADPFGSAPAR